MIDTSATLQSSGAIGVSGHGLAAGRPGFRSSVMYARSAAQVGCGAPTAWRAEPSFGTAFRSERPFLPSQWGSDTTQTRKSGAPGEPGPLDLTRYVNLEGGC